jgi:aspartate/methionine/tyrosine aminotransferase
MLKQPQLTYGNVSMARFAIQRPITVAQRTDPFQESVIREMTRLSNHVGAINLSQGIPDFESPPEVLEAAVDAIRRGGNQYVFSYGVPEFREVIAEKTLRYNHFSCNPDIEVTVTCGVSEASFCAVLALTDPGDEIVILQPWYENYVPDCLMAGVTPRFVPLREPDYTFDPDELQKAFNNRTRLILFNTPHNPTGRVFTCSELEIIARLCQEYGVIAVVDEIYEYIVYGENRHISIASLPGMADKTVTLSGLGKTYSLTGWRVGWAIAPALLSARIRKVHDYLTICAPGPFQMAGVTALTLPKSYYSRMQQEYLNRRNVLLDALGKSGFKFRNPDGAYYVMADFSQIEWDDKKYFNSNWNKDRIFAEYLARDVGVAAVPGSSFYTGEGSQGTYVRFNFAKTIPTLNSAGQRLMNYL